MSKRVVGIDLDNFMDFYCPVCGKVIVGVDSDGKYCEHTLFIFVDSIGEFVHTDKSIEKDVAKWTDDEDFVDEMEKLDMGILDYLQDIIPETAITFEITTHGMACGPCSNTDSICINFAGTEDE
jgi:hypothetical protein